jgi:hypothetical protein
MEADIRNIELGANDLKPKFSVKTGGRNTRVAPKELGAVFPSEGDARERQGATETGAA